MFQKVGSSKQKAAKAQIALLGTALDAYRLDVGRYPTTEEGLEALRRNPGHAGWDGPYLPKDVPPDPWGKGYLYRSPGERGDYDWHLWELTGRRVERRKRRRDQLGQLAIPGEGASFPAWETGKGHFLYLDIPTHEVVPPCEDQIGELLVN